jgi:signal transduction histidine kinase
MADRLPIVPVATSDTGEGIEPKYQGVFKRLHGRDIPGTGIGLSICQRLVERLGGRMWVESEPGKGATSFLALPTLFSKGSR